MTRKIRTGVFGVGVLGEHHARIYSQLDNAALVGVYDIDPGRAEEVASKYGTRRFDRIADLAAAVEAASIAVPADKHFDVFGELIAHGLHVLVEKPIALTTAEAEQMVAAAEQKGVILQVGHVERFNPVLSFLDRNLTRPRFIEAVRLSPYPPPREGKAPRGTEVSVVLDLMIHDLEIIMHLVGGRVKDLHAVGVAVLSPTEDIANARLTFENGCVANVTASRISQESMRKIRVFQEDAYVSLDYRSQSGQIHRIAGGRISTEPVPIEKGEPLVNELRSFLECVQRRAEPRVSGHDASAALSLAAAICRRIREGGS